MTEVTATAPEGTLGAATMAFEGARVGLQDAMAVLKAAQVDAPTDKALREVNASIQTLSKVLATTVDQEARARDQWEQQNGGGGLDLDAARAEVGRRLALLADAR